MGVADDVRGAVPMKKQADLAFGTHSDWIQALDGMTGKKVSRKKGEGALKPPLLFTHVVKFTA